MFYKIRRASGSYDVVPPCEEAVMKSFPNYHERTCKTFEEFDKRFSDREGAWLSKGTNHAITDTGIIRQEGYEDGWAVQINTLKQLQQFIRKYGSIVIDNSEIIIYDDYLE